MVSTLTARERRSYFGFFVLMPLLGSALGVNGAAIFQILAVENLGLTSEQIGLAVGLGAISIPFQLLAARIPLAAAHRNLRTHVVLMSVMCLAMAWLLIGSGFDASTVVVAVIVIAVLAELAVSVLYATSFQPLLSTTVDPTSRQRLNAQGRAASGLVALGLVALVGSLGRDGRIVVVVALAAVGAVLLPMISRFRRPDEGDGIDSDAADATEPDEHAVSETVWSREVVWLIVAIGASVLPAWPFFVTYAAEVYWPTANLGVVGGAITLGALGASALWRPTDVALLVRARVGALVLLGCAIALVVFDPLLSGWGRGVTTLIIIVLATGSGSIVRLALLEMVHARATTASSVSILTMLDVVASTLLQLSFLIAGFLIAASIDTAATSNWFADPFQLSLVIGAGFLVAALTQLGGATTSDA